MCKTSTISPYAPHIVNVIRDRVMESPDHPALIQTTLLGELQEVSFRQLLERVDAAAQVLSTSGLQAYDRCGVKGGNSVEFIVQALAVLESRFCLVPIAEDYNQAALKTFTARCKLHGMVSCAADQPVGSTTIEKFDTPGVVDGQGDSEFRKLDPSFIRFTSGTTNKRKGVVLGRNAILERVEAANQRLNIGPDDRILWMLPMAHHFVVSILLYLRYGATILLPPGEDAAEVVAFARSAKASVIYASPDHYQRLTEAKDQQFSSTLRLALSTSMGLNETIAKEFHKVFGVHLTQALGIIEVGLPVVNVKHAERKPLALGQVQPDYSVTLKTHDEDEMSRIGSDSGVGEVCINGPGLFDAYLSPWVLARDMMTAEGFRTGDLGYFDEEQDLYLLGRRQNRINIGGRKFFCEEVEAVINTFPGVIESRVHTERVVDEMVIAADVVTSSPVQIVPEDLQEFCREKLNRYKIPVVISQVESLEKTPTGKIRRW